jgi:hypothetical protein
MQHDAFQGDLDQYFNDTDFWLPCFLPSLVENFSSLPKPTPRQVQLETAMEAGFPPVSGDVDPRTRRILCQK